MVTITLTAEQLSFVMQDAFRKVINERELVNPPSLEQKEFLNVEEAADFLGLKPPTIYSHVGKKAIPHNKVGGRLYFSKAKLVEWIEAGCQRTVAEISKEARNSVGGKRRGRL